MNESILHLGLVDDEDIELDAAALELALLDHPGAKLASYAELVGAMSARLAELGGDARSSAERADVLADVIAGEFGLVGDAETYDDPANADLIRVLDRRRGLPVALAILYVAAARRLGWQADALNTPGHVVVRVGGGTDPLLIDPFRGGGPIGTDELQGIVAAVDGPGVPLSPEHLAPMSNRDILTRLLLNQATRAEALGHGRRALTLYERITLLAPANIAAWWQRARLQLADRDIAAARGSLSALLEMTRDPELRARVAGTLARLPEADA